MKTFRYPAGHEHFQTMTVGELKNKLRFYPDSMPVVATWEGIHVGIQPDEIELAYIKDKDQSIPSILINVDES